jgi:hypothetical protein
VRGVQRSLGLVDEVYVFGPHARGALEPNDVDNVIEHGTDKRWLGESLGTSINTPLLLASPTVLEAVTKPEHGPSNQPETHRQRHGAVRLPCFRCRTRRQRIAGFDNRGR